jgi:hypothetical protein
VAVIGPDGIDSSGALHFTPKLVIHGLLRKRGQSKDPPDDPMVKAAKDYLRGLIQMGWWLGCKINYYDGNTGQQLDLDLNPLLFNLCRVSGVPSTATAKIAAFWMMGQDFLVEELHTFNAARCNNMLKPIIKRFYTNEPKPLTAAPAAAWMEKHKPLFAVNGG